MAKHKYKEFDKFKLSIKKQLKKDNPEIDENELEQKSLSIATKEWQKKYGESIPNNSENKYDEDGNIIVAENCKLFIQGNISTITE